jgi:hypothetical protein
MVLAAILRDASLRSAPQDEVFLMVRSALFARVSNHELADLQ